MQSLSERSAELANKAIQDMDQGFIFAEGVWAELSKEDAARVEDRLRKTVIQGRLLKIRTSSDIES